MRLTKRFLSFLLILALSFSLLPAAEATTGTLVKNSGTRHEVCTSLSSQAQAYYTGNYTYDAVSALSGSSSDPMNSAMFNRLSALMRTTMTNSVNYSGDGGLQEYWPKTDANNGSSNPVLFYSDEISGNFNREHVWPNSHGTFNESGAGCDLHHLRPTNSGVNSARSSYTMGKVKGTINSPRTYAYGGKTVLWINESGYLVEVNDNIKGDVARILLYVWCRWQEPNLYESTGATTGSDGVKVIESRDTLLEWMLIDPVDTWEMSRNDQCENVQGNRNVFIDYPEYAWLVFGLTPPENYQTPSGEAMNTTSYTVTAAANNSAWGSVSVSGRTVTATPNTGYYAESATLSPAGAGTLTQNGNVFTVTNLTANCTVTVNFAAKPVVAVSFAANGGTGTMASQQVYAGEEFTLPACGFTAPGGMRFAGWKWSVDNAVYQPNATVTVDGDCTFTAQWTELSAGAEYVLVENAPSDWSGDYLIVYNAGPYAMNGSLTALDAISNYKTVTLTEKTIAVDADADNFYFTIEPNGSGYAIKAASGKYIGRSSDANGLESSDTAIPATLSLSGTNANIVSSGGAYLRFNANDGQTRFRFYKSTTYTGQQAISLYQRVEVTPPEPAVPAFKTQSLVLEGRIGVNFYLDLPEIDGVNYDESYMTFAITGAGDVTARDDFDASAMNGSHTYYAFTCYVNSLQMADTITATFHYGDGLTIEKSYSVKDYFTGYDDKVAQNPNAYSAEIRALIRAVADFGHHAQAFLAENNNLTLGTDYAEMTKCYTSSYDAETIDAIKDAVADHKIVREKSADMGEITFSLVLDSATAIRVFFTPVSGYTGPVTATLDGSAVTPNLVNGRYVIEITDIPAHELRTKHTIVVHTDSGDSHVTLSALSYVQILLERYTDSVTQNAAAAIYFYAKCAGDVWES